MFDESTKKIYRKTSRLNNKRLLDVVIIIDEIIQHSIRDKKVFQLMCMFIIATNNVNLAIINQPNKIKAFQITHSASLHQEQAVLIPQVLFFDQIKYHHLI